MTRWSVEPPIKTPNYVKLTILHSLFCFMRNLEEELSLNCGVIHEKENKKMN